MTGLARSVLAAALLATASPSTASAATYSYLGHLFDSAGAACPECRVSGSLSLGSALPPNLPATDLSASVTSFSFTDDTSGTPPGRGTGTLSNTNATIVFRVTTDALGNIATRQLHVAATSGPAWLEADGPTGSPNDIAAGAVVGSGYDGAALEPGTWTSPVAGTPVPALGRTSLYLLGLALLAAGARRLARDTSRSARS